MLQIRNYPITTEKQRLTTYMLLVFLGSFIGGLPQLLLAFPLRDECACAPFPENFVILTVLYAHAFLWTAITRIIYPAVLVYISIALILRLWKSEGGVIADDLDALHFLNPQAFPTSTTTTATPALPVASSTYSGLRDSSRTTAGVVAISGYKVDLHAWSASFCIVPLSAACLVGNAFEWVQQFLSAAGVLNYSLRSPAQQFSVTLVSLFTALVPLILFSTSPRCGR
ncbi:unnamed protein product [Dibothriocephalus latus]|uniref:Uncharacterized protein n=1 Tax=Dibothriocephalus latus TaxID=60516 RepID=A0A3P6U2I5_DIBLA|nr:unnamed protein product [Dibothriocephalus latus]